MGRRVAQMSGWAIRHAREGDLEAMASMRVALQELMAQRNPASWRTTTAAVEHAHAELQGWLRDPDYLLLVASAEDGAPVAMAAGRVERQPDVRPAVVGHIRRVYVAEGWRHQGVGKALVAQLCRFFAARGVEEVTLRYVSGNEEGERFWASLGFAPRIITAGVALAEVETRLAQAGDSTP